MSVTFDHSEAVQRISLERKDTDDGRYYRTPSGEWYPSVTTRLGRFFDQSWLKAWQKRIGKEEADRITARAARRGTLMHGYVESYLNNRPVEFDRINVVSRFLFKQLVPNLNRISKVFLLEGSLYSDRLKMAGTVDCACQFDGVRSVIDFKSSLRPKKEEDIEGYFLQATSYALMFMETYKVSIPQIVILVTVEDSPHGQVFVRQTKDFIGHKFFRS